MKKTLALIALAAAAAAHAETPEEIAQLRAQIADLRMATSVLQAQRNENADKHAEAAIRAALQQQQLQSCAKPAAETTNVKEK